jgi:tetratricopeptide (TPR) repeat protein
MNIFFIFIFLFVSKSNAFFWGKPDYKEAEELYKSMEISYKNNDCAKVLNYYDLIINKNLNDNLKKSSYLLGGECYSKLGYVDKSITIYKLAIALFPKEIIFTKSLLDIYMSYGFYEQALDLIDILKEKKDSDKKNLLYEARAYAGLGFLRKAAGYYDEYLNLDVDNPYILREYSSVLIEARLLDKAMEISNRASKKFQDPFFYIQMSRIYDLKGEGKKALEILYEMERLNICDRECKIRKVINLIFFNNIDNSLKELSYFPKDDSFRIFIEGICYYKEKKFLEAKNKFKESYENGDKTIRELSEKFLERLENK